MLSNAVKNNIAKSDKHLVILGVFWNTIQMVVNLAFSFIIRLILAKLLFPEQFGLIGMAAVFIGLIEVFNDLGIGAALIQRKQEKLQEVHFHTAFWTGLGWSIGVFLIMSLAAAPLAAIFYDEPLLEKIIPIMSLGILASPFNLVQNAQLTKQMDFKKIALIKNASSIFAGILALSLALLGAGVWSLVFNSVTALLIAVPLYFIATNWRPKLIWNKEAFHDIFGFGLYTTGTNFVNYLINNIDYLLIGKLINAEALGAYTFAFVLTNTLRIKIMGVFNKVMYPLYGKKQSDPESLKRYYLKVVSYNSIAIYPFMVFMFALAEPFILDFFGNKWVDAIRPLQILSLSVMVHMLVNSNTSLIRGMGRPDLEMKLQIFKSVLFLPVLAVGIHYYGINGAAWAVLINKILIVIIAQYTFNYLLKMKVSISEFLSAIKAPWTAALSAYSVAYALYYLLGIHFIIAGVALFSVYALVIWLMMSGELKKELKALKLARK